MIAARPEAPFMEAAPVAYAMGEPVEVGAVTTPVEAIVLEATPEETAVLELEQA